MMASNDTNLSGQIQSLLADGRKIDAIKRYREATGADLAAAKEAVEALQAGQALPMPKPVDSALETEIVSLLERGEKIEAIKLYRKETGADLKEAKDAVEAIAVRRQIVSPSGLGCLGVMLLLILVSMVCMVLGSLECPAQMSAALP